METLINLHYRGKRKCVRYVRLEALTHPIKAEKNGLADAVRAYTREGQQIVRAMIRHYPLALAARAGARGSSGRKISPATEAGLIS